AVPRPRLLAAEVGTAAAAVQERVAAALRAPVRRRHAVADLPDGRLLALPQDVDGARERGEGEDAPAEDVRLRLPRREGESDRGLVVPGVHVPGREDLRQQVEGALQRRGGQARDGV